MGRSKEPGIDQVCMHYGPRRGLSPCGFFGQVTVAVDHERDPRARRESTVRADRCERTPDAVLVGAGAKAGGRLLHARFGKRGDGERLAKPWI